MSCCAGSVQQCRSNPGSRSVDHANYTAPTRQHEPLVVDPTDQKSICPELRAVYPLIDQVEIDYLSELSTLWSGKRDILCLVPGILLIQYSSTIDLQPFSPTPCVFFRRTTSSVPGTVHVYARYMYYLLYSMRMSGSIRGRARVRMVERVFLCDMLISCGLPVFYRRTRGTRSATSSIVGYGTW